MESHEFDGVEIIAERSIGELNAKLAAIPYPYKLFSVNRLGVKIEAVIAKKKLKTKGDK